VQLLLVEALEVRILQGWLPQMQVTQVLFLIQVDQAVVEPEMVPAQLLGGQFLLQGLPEIHHPHHHPKETLVAMVGIRHGFLAAAAEPVESEAMQYQLQVEQVVSEHKVISPELQLIMQAVAVVFSTTARLAPGQPEVPAVAEMAVELDQV
jgi:hypothetical protein